MMMESIALLYPFLYNRGQRKIGEVYMEMAVVSVAHSDIEIREQVNFTDFKKIEFQTILTNHHIHQCVIVSTCNRSEVYAFAHRDILYKLQELYMNFFLVAKKDVVYLQGREVMCHLLQVTCGLESSILGEDQIFKQVKEAYQFACIHRMVDTQVHSIFQKLFQTVKEIKRNYRLSEHPRTTSYIAMKFLKQHVNLTHTSYLLCGGGEIITQCLPYIAQAKTIYVALRDVKKQKELQKIIPHIQVIPFEQRYTYLQKVDVLISATTSPHTIFKQSEYVEHGRVHWILDLALPRDVDVSLYNNASLHIWNIDDVQSVVQYHEQMKEATLQMMNTTIIEKASIIYDTLKQDYRDKEVLHYKQDHLRQ